MPSHEYTVVFLQRAKSQYKIALDWYQSQSVFAANGFIDGVDERVNMLRIDPFRYRNTYKSFYEVSLYRYPYVLVYKIDETSKNIYVASIHHHKQNPKRKYGR